VLLEVELVVFYLAGAKEGFEDLATLGSAGFVVVFLDDVELDGGGHA